MYSIADVVELVDTQA